MPTEASDDSEPHTSALHASEPHASDVEATETDASEEREEHEVEAGEADEDEQQEDAAITPAATMDGGEMRCTSVSGVWCPGTGVPGSLDTSSSEMTDELSEPLVCPCACDGLIVLESAPAARVLDASEEDEVFGASL